MIGTIRLILLACVIGTSALVCKLRAESVPRPKRLIINGYQLLAV